MKKNRDLPISEVSRSEAVVADEAPDEKGEAGTLSSLADFVGKINGDHPDLCLRLPDENRAAEEINRHLEKLESLFRHTLEDMTRIIREEKELSQTVENLNGEAKAQKGGSEGILKEASSFSESISSLLGHTAETARTAEKAVQSADAGESGLNLLLAHVESIGSDLNATWSDMEKLNQASSSISELTSMISDTAERLHLISINTAIEASKSNNKSFQVIAREIQKMGGETSEAVTRVDYMIKNMLEKVREVERALLSSKESTRECLAGSDQVREAFRDITEVNNRLKQDTVEIRDELEKGNDSVKSLFDTSRNIAQSAEGIAAEADRAAGLSNHLMDIVNSVITEIGSYRLRWHREIGKYCEENAARFKSMADYKKEKLDRFLHDFLTGRPGFELGYILDEKGIQISSNVLLDETGQTTREEGFGMDRSGKTYFIQAIREGKAFMTEIYLSSATDELCVTAAIPVPTDSGNYVIAVDAGLKGLISYS